jgi:hypothetical protein
MPRGLALLVALAVGAAGGCGSDERPLPAACTQGAAPILQALRAAPGAVRLADGTRLSDCVKRATTDAELQSLGLMLTPLAERLAAAADRSDASALELGYLVGAARRGGGTLGLQAELVRRLEQAAGLDGVAPAHRSAYRRGLRAGEARG